MLHTVAVTKGKLICFTWSYLNKKIWKEIRHFDLTFMWEPFLTFSNLLKVLEILNIPHLKNTLCPPTSSDKTLLLQVKYVQNDPRRVSRGCEIVSMSSLDRQTLEFCCRTPFNVIHLVLFILGAVAASDLCASELDCLVMVCQPVKEEDREGRD